MPHVWVNSISTFSKQITINTHSGYQMMLIRKLSANHLEKSSLYINYKMNVTIKSSVIYTLCRERERERFVYA